MNEVVVDVHKTGATMGGRRRFLIDGSRIAASVSLLASTSCVLAATAAAPKAPSSSLAVTLAVDQASQSVFRASANAASRSGDGGRHWTPLILPPTLSGLTSIAVSAGGKGVLYIAGSAVSVQRSDDGGRTWSARNDGLPGAVVQVLATHADQPETVYAYIVGHGIFRSENGGQRWRLMDTGPRGGITRFVHSNMPGSMQSGWLFVAGPQGVRRAMDCFCGWRDAGELGRAVRAVACDPRQPTHVYAATETGLVYSADGGETWSASNGPPVPIEALAAATGGTLYAAGADGNMFRRSDAAAAWERINA